MKGINNDAKIPALVNSSSKQEKIMAVISVDESIEIIVINITTLTTPKRSTNLSTIISLDSSILTLIGGV
jgi:hypothetical protein